MVDTCLRPDLLGLQGRKKHCQKPLLREKLRELAADVEKRSLTPLERLINDYCRGPLTFSVRMTTEAKTNGNNDKSTVTRKT